MEQKWEKHFDVCSTNYKTVIIFNLLGYVSKFPSFSYYKVLYLHKCVRIYIYIYISVDKESKKNFKCWVLAASRLETDILAEQNVIFEFKEFVMFLSLEICKQLVSEENVLMSKTPKKNYNQK